MEDSYRLFKKISQGNIWIKKKSEAQKDNGEYINMDLASLSKIPHNPNESKEEIIYDENIPGKEDISDAERVHQKMLQMKSEAMDCDSCIPKGKHCGKWKL